MNFKIFPFGLFALTIGITSCKNENPVPKPPTYLKTNFPDHKYKRQQGECGYSFDLNQTYKLKNVYDSTQKKTCHKDIDLGPLNGTIHFSFIEMDKPLSVYVNYSNDKVDEHKLKASAIIDKRFVRPNERVFGTFFELQGNVASPFHFYLTDSTSKFVSGVVYFNTVPNYDSLKPSLEYLKTDLLHLIESFKW